MLETIKNLFKVIDSESRVHFALLLFPMFLLTLFEVLSIGLILPVIQVLVLDDAEQPFTKLIMELLPESASFNIGVWIAFLFATVFIIKNIISLLLLFIIARVISYKIAKYIRVVFFNYISQDLPFFFENNSGDLLRNTTSGVLQSMEVVRLSLIMTIDIFALLGIFILLFIVNPLATISIMSVFVLAGVIYYFIFSPVFRNWGRQAMILEGEMFKWISQSFAGIRDIKLFQAKDYLAGKVGEIASNSAFYQTRVTTAIHIPRTLIEVIAVVGFMSILIFLLQTGKAKSEVISLLGLFGVAGLRIMPAISRFMSSASDMRLRSAYIDKVYTAFDLRGEIISANSLSKKGVNISFDSEIRLENVSYQYTPKNDFVVKNADLKIQKGETVAFVGHSGAGKSTLIDIMLGLLEPTTGSVKVDGIDINEMRGDWQKFISLVPQTTFVLDDTVARNIAFGVRDEDIDISLLEKVIRIVKLDKAISNMPEKLSTRLGERGELLSGGQAQRISIARALYKQSKILVFDEATSALDDITEREIRSSINKVTKGRTLLIVAHRLNTIRNSNKIVFLENGRILTTGTYDELLSKSSKFSDFIKAEEEILIEK